MKKVTKGIALMLAAGLVSGSLLTACTAGKKSGDGNGVSTTGNNSSSNSKNDKQVNLIWYSVGDQPDALSSVFQKVSDYTKQKINATVELRMVSFADINQKMQVVINSGEEYDICFTSSSDNPYVPNALKGAYVPLDKYLEKEGKDMKAAIDSRAWDGVRINGKIYGVPANKELPWAPVWKFSKELVEKYKIDISKIKDIKSLEPALEAIKKNEPNIIPIGVNKNGLRPTFIDPLDLPATPFVPVATKYDDKDSKAFNYLETAEATDFFKTVQKYYQKGYIHKDAPTTNAIPKNSFVSQGHYQPYAETIWEREFGYPIVVTPRYKNVIASTSVTGSMQAVSASSKNPERAVQFLNLLNTDAQLKNLVTYGVEDVHYKKTSDTSIQLLPEASKYKVPAYTLGNHFITYTVDPDPKDKWKQFEKFNKDAEMAPLFGFYFDTSSVNTEIAAVKSITQQYFPMLFTGSVTDVDATVAEMNKKLNDAGLKKVITELQKQIDSWKANKK